MSPHKEALSDLFKRYLSIWRHVWKIRHELDPPEREKDERDFLPAHLELTETPVSIAPKWTARLIMLFALLALLWAWFGQLDIVVVAQGKTEPSGQSKVIQPLETAEVKHIYVQDGQQVKQGELLIELSALGSDSDVSQVEIARQTAQLAKWRSEALLQALDTREPPQLSKTLSISEYERSTAQLLITNQYQAWLAQDQQLQARIRQNQAEAEIIRSEINKLKQLGQIEKQRTADLAGLVKQNFIAEHIYLEQKSKLLSNQNDLKSKSQQLLQIQAAIDEAQNSRELNTQILRRDTSDALRQANEELSALQAQWEKAKQRQELMRLSAPVDGTVQQLSIHTVGGVATAAQALMVIVPNDFQLVVKANILNKDIGFIHVGQKAVVKVEAFPYTRYGYLNATVQNISEDAIAHEQLGLIYSTTLALESDTLIIEGTPIRLSAGMNVSAEIKTGKRQVIDYLLSPLQTTLDESMKQR